MNLATDEQERRCGDEIAAQVELSGDGRRDSQDRGGCNLRGEPRPSSLGFLLALSGEPINRSLEGTYDEDFNTLIKMGPGVQPADRRARVHRR